MMKTKKSKSQPGMKRNEVSKRGPSNKMELKDHRSEQAKKTSKQIKC
jgi:hypothetical protein